MRSDAARAGASAAVVAAVTVVVAGCSSGHSTGSASTGSASTGSASTGSASPSASATSPAPSATSASSGPATSSPGAAGAAGGPANVDVTFSGAVTGHFDNPVRGPKYACGTPDVSDLWVINDVEGTVGGAPYSLQISVNNFTGSGKQTGNVVISVTPGSDASKAYLSVEPPNVAFTDPTSGTVDGDAQQGLDSAAPTIHVSGTFHC
jgi:hypothetical protein